MFTAGTGATQRRLINDQLVASVPRYHVLGLELDYPPGAKQNAEGERAVFARRTAILPGGTVDKPSTDGNPAYLRMGMTVASKLAVSASLLGVPALSDVQARLVERPR